MPDADGLIAHAVEIVAISEVEPLLVDHPAVFMPFTERELGYARSKTDPARRLAARLAAKRAACALLGPEVTLADFEVMPALAGPPFLRLSPRAGERLLARGANRVLLSLTHGQTHAAASVLIAGDAS